MKSLLLMVVGASLLGLGLGVTLAYVEVRPVSPPGLHADDPAHSQHKPDEKAEARAEFTEMAFDFDRMERGSSMSHDFVVKNVGTGPLEINFESSTCKCTGVKLKGKRVELGEGMKIPPGEQAHVTLEWAAKAQAGPFRHGAHFSTNDPAHFSVNLEAFGEVVESTAMRPAELLFGTLQAGESREATIYLMSFLQDEVELLDYEITPPKLAENIELKITAAENEELPDAGAIGGLKIAATYKAGGELGPIRGWLNMETNLPNAEKLSAEIIGSVKGDVSIYGPGWNAENGLLRIGTVMAEEGKSIRLNLSVQGEHASTTNFEVAKVDPALMKVTLGEPRKISEKRVHFPVEIEIPPNSESVVRVGGTTSEEAEIVFKSNHPQAQEVRMRVQFAVIK